jgi:hypothetical protein
MTVMLHKGSPVATQDLGLWHGDIVTMLPDCKTPGISWKGAPLPANFFSQMLGFFRHVHKTWGSEAMVRLAYNTELRQWRMLCYPQTIKQGMEIKEIKDLTDEQRVIRDEMIACLNEGFMENGSSHSHCDMLAFQSGTDLANELKNTGIHITLGNINSERPSVHGRVSFRGIMYAINWKEWFEGWPEDMDGRCDSFNLIPGDDLSFPQEWLKCCFEPPPITFSSHSGVSNWLPSGASKTGMPTSRYEHRSWRDKYGDYYDDDDMVSDIYPSQATKKYPETAGYTRELPARIDDLTGIYDMTEYLYERYGESFRFVDDRFFHRFIGLYLKSDFPEKASRMRNEIAEVVALVGDREIDFDEFETVSIMFDQMERIYDIISMIEVDDVDPDLLVDVLTNMTPESYLE